MKIKELIAKLQKFDPEKEIVFSDPVHGYPCSPSSGEEGYLERWTRKFYPDLEELENSKETYQAKEVVNFSLNWWH